MCMNKLFKFFSTFFCNENLLRDKRDFVVWSESAIILKGLLLWTGWGVNCEFNYLVVYLKYWIYWITFDRFIGLVD
jgi:hypothetical protein